MDEKQAVFEAATSDTIFGNWKPFFHYKNSSPSHDN